MQSVPFHKQLDPNKQAAQIIGPPLTPPSKLYKPAHGGYPDAAPIRPRPVGELP